MNELQGYLLWIKGGNFPNHPQMKLGATIEVVKKSNCWSKEVRPGARGRWRLQYLQELTHTTVRWRRHVCLQLHCVSACELQVKDPLSTYRGWIGRVTIHSAQSTCNNPCGVHTGPTLRIQIYTLNYAVSIPFKCLASSPYTYRPAYTSFLMTRIAVYNSFLMTTNCCVHEHCICS